MKVIDDKVFQEMISKLSIEDLPHQLQPVAKVIGVDSAIKLASSLGGTGVYVPKVDSVMAKVRDSLIMEQFNGHNYRDLALKFGLTEVWIRQIVNRKEDERTISLFEN